MSSVQRASSRAKNGKKAAGFRLGNGVVLHDGDRVAFEMGSLEGGEGRKRRPVVGTLKYDERAREWIVECEDEADDPTARSVADTLRRAQADEGGGNSSSRRRTGGRAQGAMATASSSSSSAAAAAAEGAAAEKDDEEDDDGEEEEEEEEEEQEGGDEDERSKQSSSDDDEEEEEEEEEELQQEGRYVCIDCGQRHDTLVGHAVHLISHANEKEQAEVIERVVQAAATEKEQTALVAAAAGAVFKGKGKAANKRGKVHRCCTSRVGLRTLQRSLPTTMPRTPAPLR